MRPTAKRILCVEPVSDIADVIVALLRARSYVSDSAATIAEALEKAWRSTAS